MYRARPCEPGARVRPAQGGVYSVHPYVVFCVLTTRLILASRQGQKLLTATERRRCLLRRAIRALRLYFRIRSEVVSEYELRFASVQAKRGWTDLKATIRNSLVDSWDFLTRTPQVTTPTNYRLRGDLGSVSRGGDTHDRWRHKPNLKGDARIWFYVVDQALQV
jgi:hypothetical protein